MGGHAAPMRLMQAGLVPEEQYQTITRCLGFRSCGSGALDHYRPVQPILAPQLLP